MKELRQVDVQAMASENRRITALQLFALPLTAIGALCSGQPIPDSGLSFSSATAGGNPSLN
ncbi:hypothetical protein JTM11_29225, partial [Pseudomonas aeruginosa]|uniref:hypothetical protein n=1 Tax=Pseudomonas aeruginosa TaxID=287 RepID=UPI001E048BCD